MAFRYYICDVFTDRRFGGNPLAVIPDATGINDAQMQQVAREFNFSETTFVLPAEQGHTRRVRIFTPSTEVPFAGHPNVGTAFVLSTIGELGDATDVVFEEAAGTVAISLSTTADGLTACELKAPQNPTLGDPLPVDQIAAALRLDPGAIVTTTHPPQTASVGLPFVMVELSGLAALQEATADAAVMTDLRAAGLPADIHLYIHDTSGEFDIRARMFAPLDGVPEDPATGSANCALVALLSHYSSVDDGELSWRIAQGVEMGRPSTLLARTRIEGGQVAATYIGGTSVMFAAGELHLD